MYIKVLQWNIWYKEKIENVVKLIKELDADIVCLQELGIDCKFNSSVPNTAEYIKDAIGYNSFFYKAQQWEENDTLDAIGNGIFSRFPFSNTSFTYVQEPLVDSNDYSHEGRVYLEVEVHIDNMKLVIGTTHLSYTDKFIITEDKKQEVDKLVAVIKEKKSNYIFTGDLNSIPDSYVISEISKYLINAGPDFRQNTWTTKSFDYKGFKEDKLNWRLDYIFTAKDVQVISSEIVKTDYSDHLPILITASV